MNYIVPVTCPTLILTGIFWIFVQGHRGKRGMNGPVLKEETLNALIEFKKKKIDLWPPMAAWIPLCPGTKYKLPIFIL